MNHKKFYEIMVLMSFLATTIAIGNSSGREATVYTSKITIMSDCLSKNFLYCNSLSNCVWVGDLRMGHCASKSTTTTSTTIPTTSTTVVTTTVMTTTISDCSGKSYWTCVSSVSCKWIGDIKIGHCVSKPVITSTTTTISTITTTTISPNNFILNFSENATPQDIIFTTNDSNFITYQPWYEGITINATNYIEMIANNTVSITFAMDNFYPVSGPALCNDSNVLHVEKQWEYRLNRSGILSDWKNVTFPRWLQNLPLRGDYLGTISANDTWSIDLRGKIPSPCNGNWNFNGNQYYIFWINGSS
jgi:hypothetical protein